MTLLGVTGHLVNVLEVTAKVSTLGERLLTQDAGEGPLAGVLPKMVPEIAALLKDTLAASVAASEVEFDALADKVLHLNGLMPLRGDTLEGLRLNTGDHRVLVRRELRSKSQI